MSRFEPGSRKRTRTFASALQRAHRPDREAALAQVQRQRRGDGVAEAVGDRDAEHDARAAAAVEVVGEQVRRERRQDVLHGAVLVDVAGDAERREVAHLVGGGDRAAEDEDRQPALDRACGSMRTSSTPPACGRRRSRTIRSMLREVGAHAGEQLRGALHRERRVPGAEQRRGEPVPHERGVVGDDDGLGGGHEWSAVTHGSYRSCAMRAR